MMTYSPGDATQIYCGALRAGGAARGSGGQAQRGLPTYAALRTFGQPNNRMQLTEHNPPAGGPALRASVIQSRLAAAPERYAVPDGRPKVEEVLHGIRS